MFFPINQFPLLGRPALQCESTWLRGSSIVHFKMEVIRKSFLVSCPLSFTLCVSVCLYFYLYVFPPVSLYFYLYVFLSVCLCVPLLLSVCLLSFPLCVSASLYFYLYVFFSVCLSVSLYFYLFVFRSVCLCLPLLLSVCLSLCVSLRPFTSICMSLSLCVSASLYFFLYIFVSLCLFLFSTVFLSVCRISESVTKKDQALLSGIFTPRSTNQISS